MKGTMNNIETISKTVNSIVWGPAILLFLIFVGIYFSIKFRFFQIWGIKEWLFGTIKGFFKKIFNFLLTFLKLEFQYCHYIFHQIEILVMDFRLFPLLLYNLVFCNFV